MYSRYSQSCCAFYCSLSAAKLGDYANPFVCASNGLTKMQTTAIRVLIFILLADRTNWLWNSWQFLALWDVVFECDCLLLQHIERHWSRWLAYIAWHFTLHPLGLECINVSLLFIPLSSCTDAFPSLKQSQILYIKARESNICSPTYGSLHR